jgi:predicted anti-sigma-YlaC factor YlaD
MRTFPSSWACDRAREAASFALDGELSQLERALLERHVDRCPACAAFSADVTALTLELRAAAFVPLERPIELPLRRRAGHGLRHAGAWAAAASVAVTAVLGVTALSAQRARPGTPVVRNVGHSTNQDLRDLRALRIAQMRPLAFSLAPSFHGQQLDT